MSWSAAHGVTNRWVPFATNDINAPAELVLGPKSRKTTTSLSICQEVSTVVIMSATVHVVLPARARMSQRLPSADTHGLRMDWTTHKQEFSIGERIAVQGWF